jgi:radical SAM superfamily enzyme YgiQ (UPF0313 family)
VSAPRPRRLDVFLIRPSKYDDEGYVLRHLRGVLPSNTLACLHTLTLDVRDRGLLGATDVRAHLCDESVQPVPEAAIRRAARRDGATTVVCLLGVQTSQFPRATDLARRFRAQGVAVLLGGFHVSGALAMLAETPPELTALLALGVTLVKGEVEATWPAILGDVLAGTLAPVYDAIDAKPDLSGAPVPRLNRRLMRRFAFRHFGTVDTGRGCPFTCSFCTIINVQGRSMRARDPRRIRTAVVENYRTLGTHHYFFTDDNFARNPEWRAVLEDLIRARDEHGVPLRFLMQVDVQSYRIPGFVELARRAGCFQVFIGMESLDPETLRDAGKRQNAVGRYADLLAAWRDAGVLTHVGYIIGFPHDTPASVRDSVRRLREELQVDIASFFMLTPLAGSADHAAMTRAGVAIDADLNRHDTFHPVVDHPRMSRATWSALYEEAWATFYAPDYLRSRLAAATPANRMTLLQMYLWYRTATAVERYHPMMTGFGRLKPRRDRRPGTAVERRRVHLVRRGRETAAMLRGYHEVLAELRALWMETSAEGRAVAQRTAGRPRAFREATRWARFAHALLVAQDGEPDRRADQASATTTTDASKHAYANASPNRL